MKLYHFDPSPPSRIALLAARNAGVDIDIEVVNLFKKDHLTPEFLKINPQHCVPTLADGDFVMWESRAIATYLAEVSGKETLYPKDIKKRSIVDQRLFFEASLVYKNVREIAFPVIWLGETKVTQAKKDTMNQTLKWIELFLEKSTWIAGEEMTVADCAFIASLTSLRAIGFKFDDYPKIIAWIKRCEDNMAGFEENMKGANMFGQFVQSKLEPGQF